MPMLEPKDGVFIGVSIFSIKGVFLVMCFWQRRHQSFVISSLQFLCPKITRISARPVDEPKRDNSSKAIPATEPENTPCPLTSSVLESVPVGLPTGTRFCSRGRLLQRRASPAPGTFT